MNIKEISKIAEVSPSAVSLVLNNRTGVGAEKRELIKRLLMENGYSISDRPVAETGKNIRFLKYTKHSMLVDGNPGFVSSIIDAMEEECRRQHYNLMMSSFTHRQIDEIAGLLRDDPCIGIIVMGTELSSEDFPFLGALSTPLVVVDNPLSFCNVNSVTMENHRSIFAAMSYLQGLGHRKIGFISNALPSGNCRERLIAYRESLDLLGIAFDPSIVYAVNPTPEGAHKSMSDLIAAGSHFPTALVANNDSIAIGSIKAFHDFGIQVPRDVSIIGFDNIPFSTMCTPPLTTIGVSRTDIGIWAVRLLLDRIKSPHSPTAKIQVGTKLIERGSTAPFKGGSSSPYIMS
jgi:DNA-binding LacI/PurR family transcriptional regulator